MEVKGFDCVVHEPSDKDIYPGGDDCDKMEYMDIAENQDLYEQFVFYAQHYMHRLGLHDWRVEFCCVPLGGCRYAETRFSIPERLACIALNKELPKQYTNQKYLLNTALHEVMYLFFADYEWAADKGLDVSDDMRGVLLDNAQNMMINRLVPLLLEL